MMKHKRVTAHSKAPATAEGGYDGAFLGGRSAVIINRTAQSPNPLPGGPVMNPSPLDPSVAS
jgi:hypothetical protein